MTSSWVINIAAAEAIIRARTAATRRRPPSKGSARALHVLAPHIDFTRAP